MEGAGHLVHRGCAAAEDAGTLGINTETGG